MEFWAHFLGLPTVTWKESIRKLVETILAVPIATADVERGFSILTHTKYDQRSRLTTEHLRNLMFMRINGPPFDKFDAVRYAKAWIESGGMHTDDPTKQRTKQKNELTRSNLF